VERNPDSYCGTQCLSAEAIPIQAPLDVSVADGAKESKVGIDIMERVAEIYYKRPDISRAMITNLFKVFKFETGKSKFIETYYER